MDTQSKDNPFNYIFLITEVVSRIELQVGRSAFLHHIVFPLLNLCLQPTNSLQQKLLSSY